MPGFLDDAPGKPPATPIVLGLVGGIGAGKSAVAAILGQLGCLVVDADRDARAAIDRPEIQQQLVRWWGPSILNADGKVNRKAVAAIVFDDPTQRTRLESVLHPVIKAFRGEVIDRARSQGMRGVVIDAHLLFEARSDTECDAVIFVDTPLERRIEHVEARGWTAAELERRERAQMPLADKRSRCQATVVNDGSLETLAQRVKAVFEDLAARHARGETLRPSGSAP
jgi:dephospho-CoA kinase